MSASSVFRAVVPASRSSRKPGPRGHLSKVALGAVVLSATGLALSACAPSNLVWYPLASTAIITQGFHAGHPGIDMAVPWGTPIQAATTGTVTFAGWYYGYGNYTCITRDAGFRTCYGHQSAIFVRRGQHVVGNQTIGRVGQTGNATGPHLHFEIYRNGRVVNPFPYLPPR